MGSMKRKDVYKRVDEDKFARMGIVETISLERLERQLAEHEEMYNAPEPSDKELIEYAKMEHPWYIERDDLEPNITRLRKLIQELEGISLEV